MDFLQSHFRCELCVSAPIQVSALDLSGYVVIRSSWSTEGKRLMLEFEGEATEEIFQALWKRVSEKEEVTSAVMYDWDALDQHPGERKIFKRDISGIQA
jgi:hypothetical protein